MSAIGLYKIPSDGACSGRLIWFWTRDLLDYGFNFPQCELVGAQASTERTLSFVLDFYKILKKTKNSAHLFVTRRLPASLNHVLVYKI
jgi:hypothetical protein